MDSNIVIYEDPLLGLFTLKDLIYYLEALIRENHQNLTILESLLKNMKLDQTDITSILTKFDMKNNIKFITDLLSDSL